MLRVDENDEDLLERYVKGDTEALSVLIERYRRPLYGFILRMAASAHEADEIFQEVWLRVIRKASRYRRDRFRGWVYRIAHNLMIDYARRRKPNLSLDMPTGGAEGLTLAESLPSRERSPADEAKGKELERRIRQAVSQLTPEQREVFLLRMEGDVPFREIARIQRVPVNTALARMQYALHKLRAMLREEKQAVRKER